jgi:HicB family
MDLSEYTAAIRRELASITRFANEEVTKTAEGLADALESSVRLTMLEALSAAAAEITTRLDGVVIDVRLSGGEPDFVITLPPEEHAEPAEPAPTDSSDDMARITLRLSEPLKARVEGAASAAGLSVNAWLVRAISRGLESPGGSRGRSRAGIGQRYTGYARS